jgi:mono/diheme cytochrome c family protein
VAFRTAPIWLAAFGVAATAAWTARAQQPTATDDVQQGRRLADLICSNCHVAAPDQRVPPYLQPPAPSFESIAQRSTANAGDVRMFLASAHQDVAKPEGVPNPQLLDFQIEQVTAYLMSLRTPAAAQAGPCSERIARAETALGEARARRQSVASTSESRAARLHRQPTPNTVRRAEAEAQEQIDAALMLARKLNAQHKEAECLAAIEKLGLQLGLR